MGKHTNMLRKLASILIVLAGVRNAFIIDEQKAKSALDKGAFNGYWEEWFRSSNMERECIEEACSHEEYLERAENEYGVDIRKADTKGLFELNYYECYQSVVDAGLNTQGGVDLRPMCMDEFGKAIKFMNQDDPR